MRLAWFAPLSSTLSGVAAYSAGILAALIHDSDLHIDAYVDDGDPAHLAPRGGDGVVVRAAHDFVWLHARRPYDLTVYQLANAAAHAYIWGYVVRYPGLVVLHDTVLHHARASHRAGTRGLGEYRAELRYDRPELHDGVCGLAGLHIPNLLAAWPLLRPILETARRTAVHDRRAADDLRRKYPGCRIDLLRLGVTRSDEESCSTVAAGHVVFAAVPHTTCVGGIAVILRALRRVRRETSATLRILGAVEDPAALASEILAAGLDADAVTVAKEEAPRDGSDSALLSRSHVCVCLQDRPGEVTDSWLRCLAAGRPTIVGARARLADIPLLDPRSWRNLHGGADEGIAVGVDPRHEEETLWLAMRRLAVDGDLRRTLGGRALSWWDARGGTHADMLDDYRRLIHDVAREGQATANTQPAHFRADGMELVRRIAEDCHLDSDLFGLAPSEHS